MIAPSLLTAFDLHLFNEGTHSHLYEKLGAHLSEDPKGASFAVWAPNADWVSVIGDFNGWNRDENKLVPREQSGIWEGFISGVEHGALYKYHVHSRVTRTGADKADPFAVYAEQPPRQASIVWDLSYDWGDADWMSSRSRANGRSAPWSVYEVHLGSWMRVPEEGNRWLTYRELAPRLADYAHRLGFTHVEFMPVMEHPFYGSWGYQSTGYFAPTSRFGSPQDFIFLVDHPHQHGIGVILDWVPSPFPSDEFGLQLFDGTHLYEHADPRLGVHPDWGSSILNYGCHEGRGCPVSSAVYKEHPDVQTIAEESTAWPLVSRPTYLGGLGFGMKWDMGWMHDTLAYISKDPVHRRFDHNQLTFRMLYAFTENYMLPLSHDEVVHGKGSLLSKMPGDDWQKFANMRLLLAYMYALPGKKLLFMGIEFGQWSEWNHEASLDWHLVDEPMHDGMTRWTGDLNRVLREERPMHELDFDPAGFAWIDASDSEQSVISFLRRSTQDEPLIAVFNFTPVPRYNYQIGVPLPGRWLEILNSDAPLYGGSGQGNLGAVEAAPVGRHGHLHSLTLTLPPLGAVFLKPDPDRVV